VKKAFPNWKVAAFVEFHSATAASNSFYKDLLKIFPLADILFLKRVNRSRSSISLTSENLDVDQLAKDLKGTTKVYTADSAAQLVESFKNWRHQNSSDKVVELVMSNGSFENIYSMLKKNKEEN
jgi:UDP-N-acetylmuramate-alanine ligase